MTKAKTEWRPRLTVELTAEQYQKLQQYIPWGMRKVIYRRFTDDLIRNIEEHGQQVLGAFMSGAVSYKDLMKDK